MTTTKMTRLGVVLSAFLMACGAAGGLPGGGGGGKVDPNACSGMDSSDVGKKLKVFLEATAKLQTTAADLEAKAKQACTDILTELGGSAKGTTKETCDAAALAVQENMKGSIKAEAKIEAKYK